MLGLQNFHKRSQKAMPLSVPPSTASVSLNLPTGQTTASSSLPVVIASDQSQILARDPTSMPVGGPQSGSAHMIGATDGTNCQRLWVESSSAFNLRAGIYNGANELAIDASGIASVKQSAPLPAGTNVIGHVVVDSAGAVTITSLPTLPSGTNVIGHVLTDSGSTTVVTSLPALPSGSNVIGHVINDASTAVIGHVVVDSAGSVSITSLPSLPSGTNVIGHIIVDSGSVSVTQATGTNLHTVVDSGSIAVTARLSAGLPMINGEQSDFSGTFTNATQTNSVVATGLDGYGNVLVSINGTYGTATGVFEGSDDSGTTWYSVQSARDNTPVIENGYTTLSNTNQTWQINNPGFDSIRVRSTAVASGTVNVRMSSSAAPGAAGATVAIGTSLPFGNNVIGAVKLVDSSAVNTATIDTFGNLRTSNVIMSLIMSGMAYRSTTTLLLTSGVNTFAGFQARANSLAVNVIIYSIVAFATTGCADGRIYYNSTGANTDAGLTANLLTANATNQIVGGGSPLLSALTGSPATVVETTGMGGTGAVQSGSFALVSNAPFQVLANSSQLILPKSTTRNASVYVKVPVTASSVSFMIEWVEF